MKLGIHTVDTLSIRQYGVIDRTNNPKLLRRWFNPLPVDWFDTDSFFNEFKNTFGKNVKTDLRTEVYKILSYNKIVILDRMFRTMNILMKNQNDRSMFALLFKRKIVDHTGNLDYYIEKVKSLTGIEVKDGKGLEKLQKEVKRLIDKYNQRFPEKQPEKKKVDFEDIAMGVFVFMEQPYNGEMKLREFASLKVQADRKSEVIEKNKPKK